MRVPCAHLIAALLTTMSMLCGPSSKALAVTQRAELTQTDGAADDTFGYSVAVSGNTIVVGAPGVVRNGQLFGAAYVFENGGAGWVQVAKLTATNGSRLGSSVAISGDGRTVAAGAPPFENGGTVLVFVEPAGGWGDMTETAELTPEHAVEGFGVSVAISADGEIVAAGSRGGGAFVYTEPATGWAHTSQPTGELARPVGAEGFGASIAMSGNTAVVGDPEYLDANGQSVGGAFVYILRSGPHTIPISATLTASDAVEADNFGISVAIVGNTVVAGANGHNSLAGAAYVFVGPPSGWENMTQTAELTVPTRGKTTLGSSVAIIGNAILAGAPGDTIGHDAAQGAVFAYLKPPGGWVNTDTPNLSVTGSDSTAKDEFGFSVALSGNTAVIGAPYHAVNGNGDQGAAYVFGQH